MTYARFEDLPVWQQAICLAENIYGFTKCGGTGKMIRMVDPKQSHIWFECCKVCGGAYFDAGEFKDLKQESISDFFRSFFTKERK